MKNKLKVIVAVSESGVIGKDNKLPWREPEDLKYFKRMTLNSVIIMGRNTFESLPGILPNRKHVIVSRTMKDAPKECELFNSLMGAIKAHPNCFVIGGAEIYKQVLPMADEIYITEIKGNYEGDTYFEGIPEGFYLKSSTIERGLKFNLYASVSSITIVE